MHASNLASNVQAKAGAGNLIARLGAPVEFIENAFAVSLRNSRPRVLNAKLSILRRLGCVAANGRPGERIF
jgi:hypothetical protein